MNDMYFDPSDFDFTSLTDVIGIDKADVPAKPQPIEKVKEERDSFDPETFFKDDGDIQGQTFDDEQDQEQNFNDDVSDLLNTEALTTEATEFFNALPGDAVVTIGNKQLSKDQLAELAIMAEQSEQAKQMIDVAKDFDQGNRWIERELVTRVLAVDENIKQLQDEMNNAPNNTAYGEAARKMQVAQAAKQDLHRKADDFMRVRGEQEQQYNRYRIQATDQIMSQSYPDWGKWKERILNHALLPKDKGGIGINPVALEKLYDEGIAVALMESLIYRENRKKVAEKATAAANKIKHARSTPSAPKPVKASTSSDKEKAIRNMGGNRQSNVEAFKYLKD